MSWQRKGYNEAEIESQRHQRGQIKDPANYFHAFNALSPIVCRDKHVVVGDTQSGSTYLIQAYWFALQGEGLTIYRL
jgi:hypothetical protein